MQASSFGKESMLQLEEKDFSSPEQVTKTEVKEEKQELISEPKPEPKRRK